MTAAEKFRQYHADNPQVADRLESMAGQWFAAGNERVSIAMLTEVLRWSHGLSDVHTDSPYRLANAHKAHYTRLLISRNPEWADRFTKATLRKA